MKKVIKELALKYFKEIALSGIRDDEDLECFADNFVHDIERTLSARNDFKED